MMANKSKDGQSLAWLIVVLCHIDTAEDSFYYLTFNKAWKHHTSCQEDFVVIVVVCVF